MELNHRRYEEMTVPQLKTMCDYFNQGLDPFEKRNKGNYIRLMRAYDADADQWEADLVNPPALPEGYRVLLRDGRWVSVTFKHVMEKWVSTDGGLPSPYGRYFTQYRHFVTMEIQELPEERFIRQAWGPNAVENLVEWYRKDAAAFRYTTIRAIRTPETTC